MKNKGQPTFLRGDGQLEPAAEDDTEPDVKPSAATPRPSCAPLTAMYNDAGGTNAAGTQLSGEERRKRVDILECKLKELEGVIHDLAKAEREEKKAQARDDERRKPWCALEETKGARLARCVKI